MQVHHYKRIADPENFFSLVQQLEPPLLKLVVDRASVHGRKVASRIAPLGQLQCLELLSCYPPIVPESLTSLTRLRLEIAPDCCCPGDTTAFTTDLSSFPALQVRLPFQMAALGSSSIRY